MKLENHLDLGIFRAYDIRGLVGKQLDGEIAQLIGRAVGTYVLRQGQGNNLIVGMDNRLSSRLLKDNLIKGLISTGCNVFDIGLCTSPMMYWSVIKKRYSGGVIVTASHNPKEYNGFKIVGKNAYPIADTEIFKIRDLIIENDFSTGSGVAKPLTIEKDYLEKIQTLSNLQRKLKVVIDTGNAVAGKFTPKLFADLGCDVFEVNCKLDGSFPNHEPNPEHERNLYDLKNKVVEVGADLGIGFDGDGDRIGVIDNSGKFLSSDFILILFARDYLQNHPGETILVGIKCSQNVIDEIERLGGTPYLYKTGHSPIKKEMRRKGIQLGGEFSGHFYIFEDYYPFDDALFAAARLCGILSGNKLPLSMQFNNLPKRHATNLLEFICQDDVKHRIIEQLKHEFSDTNEINDIDGIRIYFAGGWALLRASNTSPALTFRAESDTAHGILDILIRLKRILVNYSQINITPLLEIIGSND